MHSRTGYGAAALVAVTLSACGAGDGFDVAAGPAKTRFAIAQLVEQTVASKFGAYRGAYPLSTICGPEFSSSWICTSVYAPASGFVAHLSQYIPTTQVRYDAQHAKFMFSPSDGATGQGITGSVPSGAVANIVKRDGRQTGAETVRVLPPMTQAEAAEQSESTVLTIGPLLTSASRAAFARARRAALATSGSSRSVAATATPANPPSIHPSAAVQPILARGY